MVHYTAQFQIITVRDHAISRQVGHVQLVLLCLTTFAMICRGSRFN